MVKTPSKAATAAAQPAAQEAAQAHPEVRPQAAARDLLSVSVRAPHVMAALAAAAGMAVAPLAVHKPFRQAIVPTTAKAVAVVPAMCGRHPLLGRFLRDTEYLLPTISPMPRPSAATLLCPTRLAAR